MFASPQSLVTAQSKLQQLDLWAWTVSEAGYVFPELPGEFFQLKQTQRRYNQLILAKTGKCPGSESSSATSLLFAVHLFLEKLETSLVHCRQVGLHVRHCRDPMSASAVYGRADHLDPAIQTICQSLRPVHSPLDISRQEGPSH